MTSTLAAAFDHNGVDIAALHGVSISSTITARLMLLTPNYLSQRSYEYCKLRSSALLQ